MSFVFRGSRTDLENGFQDFLPERRAVRVHAARPVNSNSLVFLVTVLLLFMILNSQQMSPNFLLWVVLGVFLMATTLRMYATCQQLQAQAQAHAAMASGLLGHTELRLHMPPSIALATRGRLQGLRLQLALLDREFDDLDYETLRALDSDNAPATSSMSEEEINALPVHKYKITAPQSGGSAVQKCSSSALAEAKVKISAKSLSLSSLPSLPGPKKNLTLLIATVTISVFVFVILVSVLAFYLIIKIRNREVIEEWEFDVGPHRFTYQELKKATRGFREKELLGFGGFGKVYKGTLPNSTEVAVKRISHESKQGLREFASEIASIGRLRHRNLVQLQGWCRQQGDLLLVYDFMPNGSLDKYLFDEPKIILSWDQRFHIIKGVAYGLLYLHEEWEQTVIHRDIKAGNVLLDSDFNGRLSDFGLAKLYERGSNPSTTRVVGTLGYLAPELTRTGKPTTSSDVFAFGALLLEVVCGRRPIEPKALPEELILVDWVWDKWRTGAILDVVDPRLSGEFNELEAIIVLKLGLMCSNGAPNMRPSMRQALRYLEGEVSMPESVKSPMKYDERRGDCSSGVEFEDYVHSYPLSSNFEKASGWSSCGDYGDIDVEGGSDSPLSNSLRSEGR